MTVFDSIKDKNIDELADWIDKNFNFDNAPYWHWWDKNYCQKCEPVIHFADEGDYGYCELHNKCRFFKEMEAIPDNKQTIKMWLESEFEDKEV